MQLETSQWPAWAWNETEEERRTATEREKRECWGKAGRDLTAVCHPAGFWCPWPILCPPREHIIRPPLWSCWAQRALFEWSAGGAGGWLGLSLLGPDRMVLTERFRGLIPPTTVLQPGEFIGGSAEGQTHFNTMPSWWFPHCFPVVIPF